VREEEEATAHWSPQARKDGSRRETQFAKRPSRQGDALLPACGLWGVGEPGAVVPFRPRCPVGTVCDWTPARRARSAQVTGSPRTGQPLPPARWFVLALSSRVVTSHYSVASALFGVGSNVACTSKHRDGVFR
jgi:hypothetical protein